MTSLFENVRDKVSSAAKSAVKASNELIEVTKLNSAINSQKDKMKALMLEIGELAYNTYKDGKPLDDEMSQKCESIAECEKSIEEIKEKILDIKDMKKCDNCSAEVDHDVLYCPRCGNKFEI
ncbi:MAG TPA: zinc-ribbon domain-containing protein [Clostridia bacterium]|nr:zinc-ribbon domain-containing protein [Clostridia bacterium]